MTPGALGGAAAIDKRPGLGRRKCGRAARRDAGSGRARRRHSLADKRRSRRASWRAGRLSSNRFSRRWTRRLALIAANDRGHVRAMHALGASPAEIARIRADDRRAQGIDSRQEAEGRAVLRRAQWLAEASLLVARLAHGRAATVTDPLAQACAAPPDLLVAMPGEIAFFGDPARAAALDAALPGGWSGGDPPRSAFWGTRTADAAEALAVLTKRRAIYSSTDHIFLSELSEFFRDMRGNDLENRSLDNNLQGGRFSRIGRTPAD